MKFLSTEQTFYVYLEIGPKENWEQCAKKLISKMRKDGYIYRSDEFGDCKKEYQDDYGDGRAGAPFFFRKLNTKIKL